jgi:hypothetical protein
LQSTECSKNNTSGIKGVSKCLRNGKWQAGIKSDGKRKFLGYFDCPAAAAFAYQVAVNILHVTDR